MPNRRTLIGLGMILAAGLAISPGLIGDEPLAPVLFGIGAIVLLIEHGGDLEVGPAQLHA